MATYEVGLPDGRTVTVEGPSGMADAAKRSVKRRWEAGEFSQMRPLGEVGALAEIGASGLSSALGGVVAYPYGAYKTYTEGEEAGQEARRRLQESMTYEPRLPESKMMEYQIGQAVGPYVEKAMPYVERGLSAIERSAEGALAPLGEDVSQTGGYLMRQLPQTALEATGLYGLKTALGSVKKGTVLRDQSGRPTQELRNVLEKQGLTYEALAPEAQAAIPDVMPETALLPAPLRPERRELGTEVIGQEVRAGSTQKGVAPYTMVGEEVVPDIGAQAAIKQGWDEGFVAGVKQSTPETRQAMLEMLDRRRQIAADRTVLKEGGRPSDIAGDELMRRYDFIRGKMNDARKELDSIANEKLAGVGMNTQSVLQTVKNALDDLGVDVIGTTRTGKPVLDFKNSAILKDKASQRMIKDTLDLMEQGGAPDALRFHKLKRQLDSLIDYRVKSGKGVTKEGQRFLSSLRGKLNAELRALDPDYARVNDVLSEGIDLTQRFEKSAGANVDMSAPNAQKLVGQQLRRLFGNTQQRVNMEDTIIQFDDMAKRLGGDFKTDVWDLAQFSNELDNRFGAVAKTSFKGDIESAVETAMRGIGKSKGEMAVEAISKIAKQAKGVTDENAYQTMESILRRGMK
jgi:hypothetical protein